MNDARAAGLQAVKNQQWTVALVYLNKAMQQAIYQTIQGAAPLSLANDITLLDSFGEAAYRSDVPEALSPYQNYYKYPSIAVHMARAFLMLGDVGSSQEFLAYSVDSGLKAALKALQRMSLEIDTNIEQTGEEFFSVAEAYPNLNYPEFWRALAPVADALSRHDLIKQAERNSKSLAYADPHVHFNQALRFLGRGEFRAGWRLYEWRLVPSPTNQTNALQLGNIPMWEGQDLTGKKLVIFLEQGLGDGIFSLRYVKLFLEQGVEVEVIARKAILPLLKSSFPKISLRDEGDVAVVDYWDRPENKTGLGDYWVYAMSIPYRGNYWQPIQTGQFLLPPTDLVKEYTQIIKAANTENLPVYTVNWFGRIDTESDRSRAFSAEEFAQVAGLVTTPAFVISVQKEAPEAELEKLRGLVAQGGGQLLSPQSLDSFAETAAWIAASDRLLTCDTSVAHVGGALGHPTTVLARNKAIWQWRHQDGKSIWYDSVTVTHALSPEVSWLFTKIGNTVRGRPGSDVASKNADKAPSSPAKNAELTGKFQERFSFAGRLPPKKISLITPEMKLQLLEQIEMQISRGNEQAAETIRQLLKKEGQL